MKLVLIGIVGSGKSTQGNLLSEQFGIPYLSTGHIFRNIAKEKTSLGQYVKRTMAAGLLISDDKTVEIVEHYLRRPEYQKGYIVDGFPRTLEQVKRFKNNIDKVIYIDIPEKEALWRLAYRADLRTDDNIRAIRKRIEVFHKFVEPVIQYYEKKGQLVVVDGTKKIKDVNREILKSLGKQVVKNKVKEWKKNSKSIIAIVGLSGSGKTEAADFFMKKGLPMVAFGKIINEYVEKHNLSHTEDVHKKVREDFRKQYGFEAMAKFNKEYLEKALDKNTIVVVDGVYSWEEYLYLKKTFPKVKIYLLALFADKHVRYRRISRRKYRPKLQGEDRDINELIGTHKGPPIAYADFLIKNNFSKDELYDKLEEVYRSVYFS